MSRFNPSEHPREGHGPHPSRFTFSMHPKGDVVDIPGDSESDEGQWIDNGYDSADMSWLIGAGLTLEEANEWQSKHFNAWEAVEWCEAGFSPEEAAVWRSSGFESWQPVVNKANEARMLLDAGLTKEEACEWADAVSSVRGNNITYVGNNTHSYEYLHAGGKRGTAAVVALGWREAGFTLDETKILFNVGLRTKDTIALRRNELSIEEMKRWASNLMDNSAESILGWRKSGFSPQEAREWENIPIARTFEDACKLREAEITYEEARQYVRSGVYHADDAIRCKSVGITPEKVLLQSDMMPSTRMCRNDRKVIDDMIERARHAIS